MKGRWQPESVRRAKRKNMVRCMMVRVDRGRGAAELVAMTGSLAQAGSLVHGGLEKRVVRAKHPDHGTGDGV